MRPLGRDLGGLLTADLLSRIVPLVVWPVVVRRLGPEAFGRYAFSTSLLSFLALAASFGVVPYAVRELAQSPAARWPSVARGILSLRGKLAVAVFVLAIPILSTLPLPGGTRVLVLVGSLGLVLSWADVGWVFLARGAASLASFAGLAGQVAAAVLAIGLVRGPGDVGLYVGTMLAGSLATVAVSWGLALRQERWIREVFRPAGEAFRPELRELLALGTASLGSALYNKADAVILGYLVPTRTIGLYSAAYKLFEIGLSGINVVFQALMGRLARVGTEPERLAGAAAGAVRVLAAAVLPGAAATFFLAGPALRLVCGEEFLDGTEALRILALALPAAAMASLGAGGFLMLTRRSGAYAAVVWSAGLLNVLLNLLLIPRYGILAAAATTVVAQAFVAIVAVLIRPARIGLSFLRPAWLGAATASGLLAFLWALRTFAPNGRTAEVVAIGIGAAGSLLGLWLGARERPSRRTDPAAAGGRVI